LTQSSDYRPDIDGLRAIAVLLVVFYHAGFPLFPGGFIGVDIFFVLSGYLITGIVDREIEAGSFRLTRFYTRRIKRILPAFYCMVFACAMAGYAWLLPPEFLELAKSALAGTFFVSNLYFSDITEGYFAPGVDALPLLHSWSLSVEEQFYFVWPLGLLLFSKSLTSRQMRALLIGFLVASFAAAEIAGRNFGDGAYFAVWSRAGELLVGAVLAVHHRRAKISLAAETRRGPHLALEALATFAGFGLIFGPAWLLNAQSVFPGLNALWPCLGIALLIHLGRRPGALSHSLLHFPPMVFVGLISYPLYLWHWPVFVFARSLRIEPTLANQSALIALSLTFSTLSWWLIERPIRYRRAMSFRLAFLGIFVTPAIGFAAISLFIIQTDGWMDRFSPQIRRALQIAQAGPAEARGICHHLDAVRLPPEAPCLLGKTLKADGTPVDEPAALLWGDSIANHFSGFFDELGKASNLTLRDVTMGGCPPLLGTVRLERKKGRLCRQRNDEVLEYIKRSDINTVYIAGYWTSYLQQDGFLGDDLDMSLGTENSRRVVRDGFERTISAVHRAGKRLVIMRNVPVLDSDGPGCELKNAVHPAWAKRKCGLPIERFHENTAAVDDLLEGLRDRHPDLEILGVSDLLCSDTLCASRLDGIPIYKWGNRSHLNMAGSRALGRAYLDRHGPLERTTRG